jgi:creatinine amidohydrolase
VGDARAASADKGRALVLAAAQALAQLLQELHALPAQTLAPAPG